MNFEKKFELLQSLSPDIAIIQECERLDVNHFPNCQYFWCGKNEDKSMAVLVFNRSAKFDPIHNDNLIYFLPIISDDIKVLGVKFDQCAYQDMLDIFISKGFIPEDKVKEKGKNFASL